MVVRNQIRWIDLCMVKNDWEEQTYHAANRNKVLEHQDEGEHCPYKVCGNDFSASHFWADLKRYWLHQSISR